MTVLNVFVTKDTLETLVNLNVHATPIPFALAKEVVSSKGTQVIPFVFVTKVIREKLVNFVISSSNSLQQNTFHRLVKRTPEAVTQTAVGPNTPTAVTPKVFPEAVIGLSAIIQRLLWEVNIFFSSRQQLLLLLSLSL